MTPEEIREVIKSENPKAEFVEGYDGALHGVAYRFADEALAVYDINLLLRIFMTEGMTEEDAWEHFHFNIMGAWQGEFTPIFVQILE